MGRPLTSTRPAAPRSRAGRPAPRVHGRLWRELADARFPVTSSLLSAVVGASFQTVDHRLGLWVNAGLVERLAGRPHRYRLHDDTERTALPPIITAAGRTAPHKATAYQRVWSAIRVLKRFDLPSLAIVAGVGDATLRGYVALLTRTGYVRMESLGNPRIGTPSAYLLVRNTGRVAPAATVLVDGDRRRREFVDANTGERHDISRGAASRSRQYRRAPAQADGG